MASAGTVKVAVESVIHDAIQRLLQQISDQHKITVRRISVEWIDISTVSNPRDTIREIEIESSKRGG